MNANSGFEQGSLQYWSTTDVDRITSQPFQGADYANFNENGSILEQTVHVEWPAIATRTLEVRARYKFVSGSQGDFNFKVYTRGRNFPTGSNCTTDNRYTDNQNFNTPFGWTGTEVLSLNTNTTTFATSWREVTVDVNTEFDVASTEMHSLRLKVTNGGNAHAFMDNLEIREA